MEIGWFWMQRDWMLCSGMDLLSSDHPHFERCWCSALHNMPLLLSFWFGLLWDVLVGREPKGLKQNKCAFIIFSSQWFWHGATFIVTYLRFIAFSSFPLPAFATQCSGFIIEMVQLMNFVQRETSNTLVTTFAYWAVRFTLDFAAKSPQTSPNTVH
jgi:hypothetical protein